jgi:hypothetical protein
LDSRSAAGDLRAWHSDRKASLPGVIIKSLYLLKNYQKFGGMSIKAMKIPGPAGER